MIKEVTTANMPFPDKTWDLNKIESLNEIETYMNDLKDNGYVAYCNNDAVTYNIRINRERISRGLPDIVLNLIAMLKDKNNERKTGQDVT
jgi:phosphopantetheine adenylyltransferase